MYFVGSLYMKVAIRYYSRTGSTRDLAFAIQEQLGVAAETIDIPIPSGVDLLFLGTATYKGRTAREISDFILTLRERKITVVFFSSSVFRKSNHKDLCRQLKSAKITFLPESFYSGSIFWIFNRKRPNEADLKNIKNFSKEIVRKYLG
ncbi:hypothetical protein EII17_01400 [Clostridiales bacterium COT073_COT-073]|nr:hypothetical protein EII17_01400 [Clostridiales bacterium COT073_COT-073]